MVRKRKRENNLEQPKREKSLREKRKLWGLVIFVISDYYLLVEPLSKQEVGHFGPNLGKSRCLVLLFFPSIILFGLEPRRHIYCVVLVYSVFRRYPAPNRSHKLVSEQGWVEFWGVLCCGFVCTPSVR